jgi:hypothetical protein
MHDSVHAWIQQVLTEEVITGKDVIEVGSMDVNGSVRPYVMSLKPASYTGFDMRDGPGVDVVCDASQLDERTDIVISTEMLEHAQDWKAALLGMAGCVRPAGFLVLTTRSPGFPKHDHPGDYWRFTYRVMRDAVYGCGLLVERLDHDPEFPGVFAMARKPSLSDVEATPVE